MSTETALTADPRRAAAIDRAWDNLSGAGPTLNAAERHAVIETARSAWAGADPQTGNTLEDAAYWLARDAGGITARTVDELERRGLDRHRYLETVGVVARLANVDFYARGIGIPAPELPATGRSGPTGGDSSPTGRVRSDATITDGWVPATGPMFAPACLDALPDEGDALRDLHEAMYMPMDEMGDRAYVDVLTRAQIEFVAARTSFLNECFY